MERTLGRTAIRRRSQGRGRHHQWNPLCTKRSLIGLDLHRCRSSHSVPGVRARNTTMADPINSPSNKPAVSGFSHPKITLIAFEAWLAAAAFGLAAALGLLRAPLNVGGVLALVVLVGGPVFASGLL